MHAPSGGPTYAHGEEEADQVEDQEHHEDDGGSDGAWGVGKVAEQRCVLCSQKPSPADALEGWLVSLPTPHTGAPDDVLRKRAWRSECLRWLG